jgi:ATP-dependent Clp protease ATP-binding subunit ClpA
MKIENIREVRTKHGYDTRFGARPLNRLIENEIARVLADEVLFGKLAKGGKVHIDVADDKLAFTYSETAAPARPVPAPTE